MRRRQLAIILTILAGLCAVLIAILAGYAITVPLPPFLVPYLRFVWPALGIVTFLSIVIAVLLFRLQSVPTTSSPYRNLLTSSVDLEALLEKAVEELENITETDYNQIFLEGTLEDNPYQLFLIVVADVISPHKQDYREAAITGLLGLVHTEGRTINAKNVNKVTGYFPAVPETKSELVVPISGYGVLNSESEEIAHYSNEMQQKVEQLAASLAEILLRFWHPRTSLNELPYVSLQPRQSFHGS